jgi:hypothetical protein
MRNRVLMMSVLLGLAAVMIPGTAAAIPPEVVLEYDLDASIDIPAGEICPFELHVEQTGSVKVTVFYHSDGTLDRGLVTVRATLEWSSVDVTAWEIVAFQNILDVDAETVTQLGNSFNIHAGAGGILVNDSGLLALDSDMRDVVVALNGPHQSLEGDFDSLCEALSP